GSAPAKERWRFQDWQIPQIKTLRFPIALRKCDSRYRRNVSKTLQPAIYLFYLFQDVTEVVDLNEAAHLPMTTIVFVCTKFRNRPASQYAGRLEAAVGEGSDLLTDFKSADGWLGCANFRDRNSACQRRDR